MAKKVDTSKILGGLTHKPKSKIKPTKPNTPKVADQAVAAIHSEPIKKMTVEIPNSLHRRLKAKAAMLDISLRQLIIQFAEEGLNNNPD